MTKLLHAGLIAVPIYGALSSPSLDAISGPGGSSDSGVCKSTKCEEVAAYIKKSLAPNYMALDPCVDFEQYACNGWANTHDITPSQNTTTPPDVLSDDNDRIIQAALTGPYMANTTLSGVNAFDRKNFQKIQQTYAACMNDDSIKAYGVTPLRKMLDEFDAVFPANATNSSAYDLTGALIWLFKRDVTSMIALSSAVSAAQLPSVGLTRQADNTNNYTTILQTAMPGEGLRSTSYFFDLQKPVPAKTVAEMFQVIWSAKSIDEEPIPLSRNGSLFKKAQHVVDYERLLFPYVNGSAFDQRNETKTVHELQKLIPEIDFLRFLQGVAPPTFRIDINQEVQVFHMDYYRNLSRIINSSSRDTLRAYFQWQLITMWADRFHDSYSAPIQRYQNQILERDLNYTDPRPDTCRLEVYINLPYLYDGMFIQRAFTMKDKVLGERIVRELRDAITADVKTRRWMTEKSKASVAMKAKMAQLVGFQTNHPNEGDPKELSEYYAGLPVTDDYFENGLAFSKFRRTNFWANLFTSYNRDNLTLQPVDYRPPNIPFAADLYVPFYVSRLNMIDVPAGTMQMPRFHVDIPEYVTYAAWGSTIVREIIEGLYGFKQYRGLLDNSTSARFEQESECFASQYKQYIAEDFKGRNRTRDRIEDEWAVDVLIEDQQSLRITYQAWRARSNSTQHNPRLPGLHEFTNDQLFFINFANSLCGKSKGEMPVNYKRIMATLPASVDFRKAFSCPAVKQAACEL